jgi:hypothetical protein
MTAPTPADDAPIGRSTAMVFAARSALVLALLGIAIFGIERLILAHPLRLGPDIEGFPFDRVHALRGCDGEIVYFGDSVVEAVAVADVDRRTLSTILADDLEVDVRAVTQPASSIELHAAWLRALDHADIPPRAVIIAINPRSFSPHWERNPGWISHDSAAMIEHPLYARLLSVLEWDWDRPTMEEYVATPVIVGGAVIGKIASLDGHDPGGRGRYTVRYASDYARSTRFAMLRELIEHANTRPYPVVFYLTPIDIDVIRTRLSPARIAAVETNLALLRGALAHSRSPVVDASELVRASDFDHPDEDPHEHLGEAGRIAVAGALAAALRPMLP